MAGAIYTAYIVPCLGLARCCCSTDQLNTIHRMTASPLGSWC